MIKQKARGKQSMSKDDLHFVPNHISKEGIVNNLKKQNMYQGVKAWNPFVGCRFDCAYCRPSFQRVVKRVWIMQGRKEGDGCRDFSPHEHPERLKSLPSGNVIWPCAHGDISFARPEFIKQVIGKTKEYPAREFYLQSKNPACFNQYLCLFPENTILLTTLETNRDEGYERISKAPAPSVRYKAFLGLKWPRKIVTMEPLLDFDPEILLLWIKNIAPEGVWIGYNSKPTSVRLPEPSLEKTKAFIRQLKDAGLKVREKTIRAV